MLPSQKLRKHASITNQNNQSLTTPNTNRKKPMDAKTLGFDDDEVLRTKKRKGNNMEKANFVMKT